MVILKKVGILSYAKIQALVTAIFGFFIGLFMALIMSAVPMMGGGPEAGLFAMFGFGMIIVMPIVYGVLGFVFGIIGAWIYNLLAAWVGGVEIELEDEKKKR